MRRLLIAGNWKMNGSRAMVPELISGLNKGLPEGLDAEVLVCPPTIYMADAGKALKDGSIGLGGQDLSEYDQGAYTGEISGDMLRDLGAGYVLVGHSERRSLFGDTDTRVASKFARAQSESLTPILCVGETLEQREAGDTMKVVAAQIDAVLAQSGIAAFENAVIAYEPVWAIGTGKTASPEQAQDVHAGIREQLAQLDARIAAQLRILYGGSMKPSNAGELLQQPDIDGGLIGGASLKADDFISICKAAG